MGEVDADLELQKLKTSVMENTVKKEGYSLVNGRVMYKGRLLLPKNSIYIPLLMKVFHDSRVGGHSGVLKNVRRIQMGFHWRKMTQSVHTYVAACDVCQQHKYSTLTPAGLLQPLPVPTQV